MNRARHLFEGMAVSEDDFKFVVGVYVSIAEGRVNTWLANDMKDEFRWDVDRFLALLDGSAAHGLKNFDRSK